MSITERTDNDVWAGAAVVLEDMLTFAAQSIADTKAAEWPRERRRHMANNDLRLLLKRTSELSMVFAVDYARLKMAERPPA